MKTFLFTGQEVRDFPAWLVACNFGRSAGRLVVHILEGQLVLFPGDTLVRDAAGLMWIERAEALKEAA